MSLIQRVKDLCEQHGTTLSGLSKQLGFSKNALYNWDTNAPSTYKILQVAKHFDVSVDYLLGFTDNPRKCDREDPFNDITDEEQAVLEAYLKVYREQKKKNKR